MRFWGRQCYRSPSPRTPSAGGIRHLCLPRQLQRCSWQWWVRFTGVEKSFPPLPRLSHCPDKQAAAWRMLLSGLPSCDPSKRGPCNLKFQLSFQMSRPSNIDNKHTRPRKAPSSNSLFDGIRRTLRLSPVQSLLSKLFCTLFIARSAAGLWCCNTFCTLLLRKRVFHLSNCHPTQPVIQHCVQLQQGCCYLGSAAAFDTVPATLLIRNFISSISAAFGLGLGLELLAFC